MYYSLFISSKKYQLSLHTEHVTAKGLRNCLVVHKSIIWLFFLHSNTLHILNALWHGRLEIQLQNVLQHANRLHFVRVLMTI